MRVLVAYDGSAGATQGIALIEALAWPEDTVVRVVNVVEPTVLAMSGAFGRGVMPAPEVDAAITSYTKESLDAVVGRLRQQRGSVEGGLLRGRAASAIVEDARAFGADLVIVGSRGHGPIASLLLGSVSSEVVDDAPCPVLVARGPTLRSMVLATDGSPSAQRAEGILAGWPIFAEVPIRVVGVAETDHPWATGIAPMMYGQILEAYAAELDQSKAEHERLAAEGAARLREAGRDADHELRTGDPAAEIVAVADGRDADVIVLGSRGRTGLTRLVLGSVARNVLSASTASVLIVRDAADQASSGPGAEAGTQRTS